MRRLVSKECCVWSAHCVCVCVRARFIIKSQLVQCLYVDYSGINSGVCLLQI